MSVSEAKCDLLKQPRYNSDIAVEIDCIHLIRGLILQRSNINNIPTLKLIRTGIYSIWMRTSQFNCRTKVYYLLTDFPICPFSQLNAAKPKSK